MRPCHWRPEREVVAVGLRVRRFDNFPGSICSFREGEQRARQGAHQTSAKTAPRSVIISAIELPPQFKAECALRSAAPSPTETAASGYAAESSLNAALRQQLG